MARKPVSVFKRPMSKKGRYRYYIQIWDQALGVYSTPRSATAIAQELDLDPNEYPSTSRTGALLIGQKLLAGGKASTTRSEILFVDFCAEFRDWNSPSCIKGKQARGQRIGKEYVNHTAVYVRNYLRPAFPSLKLGDVRPFMLEEFVLRLLTVHATEAMTSHYDHATEMELLELAKAQEPRLIPFLTA